MFIKWNITNTLPRYEKADIVVLSVGKSGRAWLRVLVNKYLSLHYGVPFDLGCIGEYNEDVPRIVYTHEMWRHFSYASLKQRLKGWYLIPDRMLSQKKVILLYRDPRDVAVSLYFQSTTRSKKRFNGSISEFIRHKKCGIHNIIKVLHIWEQRLKDHPDCLWVSYENMKKDTRAELTRVLIFAGIENVSNKLVDEAVAFSAFENMKRMEQKGEFNKAVLKPGNLDDPNSFKVREGKVGGYVRHFSKEEVQYLDEAISTLSYHYGYKS